MPSRTIMHAKSIADVRAKLRMGPFVRRLVHFGLRGTRKRGVVWVRWQEHALAGTCRKGDQSDAARWLIKRKRDVKTRELARGEADDLVDEGDEAEGEKGAGRTERPAYSWGAVSHKRPAALTSVEKFKGVSNESVEIHISCIQCVWTSLVKLEAFAEDEFVGLWKFWMLSSSEAR